MARDFKFFGRDMQKLADEAKKQLVDDVGKIVKKEGVNHFTHSWDNQGFEDEGVEKWKPRKAPRQFNKNGTVSKTYKRFMRKNGRPILYSHATDRKGTHLRDSIKARRSGRRIIFSTNKAYAKVHNEGGRAGRGRGFIMPRRKFMGRSTALERKIEKKIDNYMNELFK